jgi:hypothetical protein
MPQAYFTHFSRDFLNIVRLNRYYSGILFSVICNNMYQRPNRKVVCYKESSLWQRGTSAGDTNQPELNGASNRPSTTPKKIFIRSPGIACSQVVLIKYVPFSNLL